jgi:hypothetical protein
MVKEEEKKLYKIRKNRGAGDEGGAQVARFFFCLCWLLCVGVTPLLGMMAHVE